MKEIRVLIVDDHKIVRQGLRHLLELDDTIKVIGEAETGEEAVAQSRLRRPHVVLMDIRILGMGGIEATRQIKESCPDTNVIVLTSYADEYLSEAIEAGASGYLLKRVDYKELSQAIRAVHAGEGVIDPSLSRDLLRRFADLARASRELSLSDRQKEILRCLACGMNAREIAHAVFVSHATVKRELQKIFCELGVENRSQAVAEASRRKLV